MTVTFLTNIVLNINSFGMCVPSYKFAYTVSFVFELECVRKNVFIANNFNRKHVSQIFP